LVFPSPEVSAPAHASLVEDLARWRSQGALSIRGLELPALRQAALASGEVAEATEASEPAALTGLLRKAIAPFAGSITGRCALVLLGLDPNTFDLAPNLLREEAAEIYGVSVERFRREPQKRVLATVAEWILELCHAYRARLARIEMERRHPADTRMAVQWLERFETYFQIWTPVYALGADLTAYRSTLLHDSGLWDQPVGVDGPGDPGYSPEVQAAGYASNALFRLSCMLNAEQRFLARFGGLWLLSSPETEAAARDALHKIRLRLPTNERDHSWLCTLVFDGREDLHSFLLTLESSRIGRETCAEWLAWCSLCACSWTEPGGGHAVEYFPTARYHAGIDPQCAVHQTVEMANEYCTTIENEWLAVADWYTSATNQALRHT